MSRPPAKTPTARKATTRSRKPRTKATAAKAVVSESTESPVPEETAAPTPPGPQTRESPPRRASGAKPRVTVTSLEQSSTKLRVVLLNLAFVGAFLLLIPVLVSQFWQNDVVIDPISVPDSLAAVGLTPDVVASRLWDGLQDAAERANTSKASVTAIPTSKRIRFSIPETGISVESLVNQTRQFFNAYQTRVAGEFICADAECRPEQMQLRLRVIRDRATVIDLPPIGTTGERAYFTEAGIQVLSVLDPFVAVSATAESEPFKAVTLARHLIRTGHPDAAWAHNLIGNLRVEAGENALAAAEYRAAVALDPAFRIARINLANTLVNTGEIDEARSLLEAIRAGYPDDPAIRAGFAEIAERGGRIDEAIALFLEAAALAPNDPHYFARAGQIEAQNGRTEPAKEHLRQALDIDPGFVPALGTLGEIHLTVGDYAAAEPLFRDMADFLPEDAEAQDLHAQTLMLVDDPQGALERFEKADALDPGNVERMHAMSGALFFLDRLPEARTVLGEALALAPERADLHALLGQFDLLTGNLDSSLARYERAAELDPDNPDHSASAADALYYLGRVPEAIERLEALTLSAPDRVETWFTLGSYRATAGHVEESIAAFETFLAGAPEVPMFAPLRDLAEESLAAQRALLPAAVTGEVAAP